MSCANNHGTFTPSFSMTVSLESMCVRLENLEADEQGNDQAKNCQRFGEHDADKHGSGQCACRFGIAPNRLQCAIGDDTNADTGTDSGNPDCKSGCQKSCCIYVHENPP